VKDYGGSGCDVIWSSLYLLGRPEECPGRDYEKMNIIREKKEITVLVLCTYNVTLRRFRATSVTVENNNYYIF
jgi:hypothetical protein